MRFSAVIELSGKSATGIPVPAPVVESLGQGRRPPVQVTVGNLTYRTTIGVVGGSFMIPLSAERRAAAGVAAGDEVEVAVVLDTEPREVSVPADFAEALRDDPQAQQAFDAMPFSHRQRWVDSVTGAKTEATRERRIARAIEELRGR